MVIFAYDANYLIDNKVGVILDAEGTRANRLEEIAVTQTMLERAGRRFDLRPQNSPAILFMARSGCSSGWWIATSHRTFLCGTSPRVPMAPSAELTLSLTENATFTFAQVVQS